MAISAAEWTGAQAAFDRLESAFAARDANSLSKSLENLGAFFVYSNYPFYGRWNELKPQILSFLFENLPRENFWRLETGKAISKYEWPACLEPIAEKLDEADFRELFSRFHYPHRENQPRLFERATQIGGADFSLFLWAQIEAALNDPERLQARKTHGEKSPALRFHWQPYRPEVRGPLTILARRNDDFARQKSRELLQSDAIENDLSALQTLLDAARESWPDFASELERAPQFHDFPSDLRLLLLENLLESNPNFAAKLFFADFQKPMDAAGREIYLGALWRFLPRFEEKIGRESTQFFFTFVTKSWSPLEQGFLFHIAREKGFRLPKPSLRARLYFDFARAFDACRIQVFGGCTTALPFIALVAWVFHLLFWLFLGPTERFHFAPFTLGCVWVLVAGLTSESDFCPGSDSLQTRFRMAIFYFGALFLWSAAEIICRL